MPQLDGKQILSRSILPTKLKEMPWKEEVVVASVANINLASAPASVDGVALVANDRVLAKDQTVPAQNGIYVWAAAGAAMTRATDADSAAELAGAIVMVKSGTVNAGHIFKQTTASAIPAAPVWAYVTPFKSAIDPTVNDDASKGFEIGSIWVNTALNHVYICADATVANALWNNTSGNVDGPAVSTDHAIPRFDGATGDTLLNSGITIDDADNMLIPTTSQIQFRDVNVYIASLDDGHLDLTADTAIDINVTRTYVSGTLGIGTETVPHGGVGAAMLALEGANASVAGPHVQFTTASDNYPTMQLFNWGHDTVAVFFDMFHDGTVYRSSDAGSNFGIVKSSDLLKVWAKAGTAAGSQIVAQATALQVEADGDVMFSPAAALKTYWRDSGVYVYSSADGYLDLVSDTHMQLHTSTGGFWTYLSGGAYQILRLIGDSVYWNINDNAGNTFITLASNWLNLGPDAAYAMSLRVRYDNNKISFGTGSAWNIGDFDIYYDGSNAVIDPDAVGTGKVYIGVTADDDLCAANIGIGTVTIPHGAVGMAKLAINGTDGSTAGPHVQFTTEADDYPLMQLFPWTHDNMAIFFDAYYDGASFRSSDAESNFAIYKTANQLRFRYASGTAAGAVATFGSAFYIASSGEVMISPAAALKTYWRDATIYIASDADGILALHADGYVRVGATSTSHALAADGCLLVSSTLELDNGTVYLDTAAGGIGSLLGYDGTNLAWTFRYDHGLDQLGLFLGSYIGRQLVLGEIGAYGNDYDHAVQTNPTIFIHDATSPDVSNNKWGSLVHDGTNLVVTTGAATGAGTVPATIANSISFAPQGTAVASFTAGTSHCTIGITGGVDGGTQYNYLTHFSDYLTGAYVAAASRFIYESRGQLRWSGNRNGFDVWLTGSAAKLSVNTALGPNGTATGVHSAVYFEALAGPITFTAAYGIDILIASNHASATVTEAYGARVRVVVDSGAINTNYGFYVGALGGTTKWAFFNAVASANWKVGPGTEQLQFRDSAIYINSNADGYLALTADTGIGLNTVTTTINSGAAGTYVNVVATSYAIQTIQGGTYSRLTMSDGTNVSCALWVQHGYDAAMLCLSAASGYQIILSNFAWGDEDYDHATQTNPTLFIHDVTEPNVTNNKWGSLAHDGTDFILTTGANIGAGTAPATIDNAFRINPRGTNQFMVSGLGNVICGNQAALAVGATDGFLYVPTCAGAPVGVPTAYTGKVALVFDTTNNRLYVYDGAWQYVEVP